MYVPLILDEVPLQPLALLHRNPASEVFGTHPRRAKVAKHHVKLLQERASSYILRKVLSGHRWREQIKDLMIMLLGPGKSWSVTLQL